MATRLFGTDGVRGLANGDLTAELALDLSVAAAHVLADRGDFEGHRPFAVVGRDTRISGEFLEAAVVAGLASAGVDVLLLGVLPTPGVAHLTGTLGRRPRRDALRLPQPDARQRHQVPGARRPQARRRDRDRDRAPAARAVGPAARRARWAGSGPYDQAVDDYVTHLIARHRPPARRAQGRARLRRRVPPPRPGPRALAGAGAEVVAIHATPDGLNINDQCGSTHLESLQEAVVREGADVGFGLDGDSDRCLAVDHEGDGRRRRPDPGDPGAVAARAGPAGQGHRRRDGDEQPRVRQRDARGRDRRPADQGRRPLRARGDEHLRLLARRRAVRPRDHERPRHHRRRHPDRALGAGADGHHRPVAAGPGRGHDAAAAGAGQRPRRRQVARRRGRRRRGRGRRGGGGARRAGADPAAALGHRADRPGDGRGADRGAGPRRRRPARPRRTDPAGAVGDRAVAVPVVEDPAREGPAPAAGAARPHGGAPDRHAAGAVLRPGASWSRSRPAPPSSTTGSPRATARGAGLRDGVHGDLVGVDELHVVRLGVRPRRRRLPAAGLRDHDRRR